MRGAVKIEQVAIGKLHGDPRNTRTHGDAQITKLMASLTEFGFTQPVLVDKNNQIIAGHGRMLAAKKLGWRNVPCIRIDYLTDDQRRAYVIADNKIAEESGWNSDLLKSELNELSKLGFNIDITGFDAKSLDVDLTKIELDPKNQLPESAPIDPSVVTLSDTADFPEVGAYDFPVIRPDMILDVPDKLSIWAGADVSDKLPAPYFYNFGSDSTRGMPFAKTILGFYVDDYRFARFWEDTVASVTALIKSGYMGTCMPNFSTYFDDAKAVRLYAIYRSRWVGRFFQEAGIKIVPDISCAPQDLECVCDGLTGIRTLAIQAHQNYSKDETRLKKQAVIDFMMEELKPETVLLYAPENRIKMFPSLSRARVVRVEPRMHMKTKRKASTTEGNDHGSKTQSEIEEEGQSQESGKKEDHQKAGRRFKRKVVSTTATHEGVGDSAGALVGKGGKKT